VKTKSDTIVSQLDVSKLTADERRKLEREVLASRGDLLFSRALILFEGETEEQALPIFAESYWGATAHEKGFSFVGCGGANNYFPFVWLAESFGISWYILCDGEDKSITSTNGQLKRIGLPTVDRLDNVSVIDKKNDYEGHLIDTGYMDAIETAFTAALGAGHFDQYIKGLHGKPGKKIDGKQTTRDYESSGGRERAARDLLEDWKTRLSTPVATAIVELGDEKRRVPPAIRKLFDKISEDLKED
jgi:putative ATP-dependent endonuclease of the OLD family